MISFFLHVCMHHLPLTAITDQLSAYLDALHIFAAADDASTRLSCSIMVTSLPSYFLSVCHKYDSLKLPTYLKSGGSTLLVLLIRWVAWLNRSVASLIGLARFLSRPSEGRIPGICYETAIILVILGIDRIRL